MNLIMRKTIINIAFNSLLIIVFFACTPASEKSAKINGEVWTDIDGNKINAHGGGILFYEGTYYWYGENKGDSTYLLKDVKTWECWRADAGGVSCYSSKNLIDWKFEGIVLPVSTDPTSELNPSQVIERPKVIYNEKTHKFVMWMHIESPDYEKAHAGVAVSVSPTGTFTYLGSDRPNGMDSRDQTIFKDDDGRAYHIFSSEWNKTTMIALLNDDYTKHTDVMTRNFINESREAPAVFKYRNKYYMINSGCTGWDPNSAKYAMADSMLGKWTLLDNPCKGKDADSTFYAQSTFVLPIDGKPNQYIALFDKWDKKDLINSSYIWLPIIFEGEKPVIEWNNVWKK
ncbi:MAG: Xylan 1,3-beta-xylosidase [Bacteroidetes bacterium]|nr:Xylan 1,3-beta-xylosidase [Bacteroidota bacterium]